VRSRIVHRESCSEVGLVLFCQLPYNKLVVFPVSRKLVRKALETATCAHFTRRLKSRVNHSELEDHYGNAAHSRYQSTVAPLSRSKNGALMRTPDGGRPLGRHTPKYNPAICVTSHETTIGTDESCRVNLGRMATEYVSGLSRWQGHCGWLLYGAGRFIVCCPTTSRVR
jgi:hypothetical protein